MIVNAGKTELAKLMAGETADAFQYLACGDGTTAAALGDTALESELFTRATATISRASTLAPLDTVSFTGKITATASKTLSEFGLLNASSSGDLLSRILISPTKAITSGQLCLVVLALVAKDGGFSGGSGC